jgi:hypothetical protein
MAALRLEVEVVDSHGAVLHQLEHEGQRYVVARPGPYTVRARHNNPSTMNLTMAVDGKSCGESWVSDSTLLDWVGCCGGGWRFS